MSKIEMYRDTYKVPKLEVLDGTDAITLVTYKILPIESDDFDSPGIIYRVNMYRNGKLEGYKQLFCLDDVREEHSRFRDRMGRLEREYLNYQRKQKVRARL